MFSRWRIPEAGPAACKKLDLRPVPALASLSLDWGGNFRILAEV
jgi:hypothetical protein